jgi:hypothetical protein
MRSAALGLSLSALLLASPGRADDPPQPPLVAALSCTPVGEAGQRVRCELETRSSGATIRWADVELASVPDNVTPLKGRIGPHDAATRDASVWRFPLALVAKKNGSGSVTARVRAVVCVEGQGTETCRPLTLETKGVVRVGA